MGSGNLRSGSIRAGNVMTTLATVKFLIRSLPLTQTSIFCSVVFHFASPLSYYRDSPLLRLSHPLFTITVFIALSSFLWWWGGAYFKKKIVKVRHRNKPA